MKARLTKLWSDVASSYWFVPTLMALFASCLALGTVALDVAIGSNWPDELAWLRQNSPEGARTLLATVAGSMIGVAGVIFSITVASVVFASGQYGPRLLQTFMANRGSQVTLGTFIATFLYGLLVLRTIYPEVGEIAAFVPHLSVLVAVLLSVCSIGVLIFFIHHAPQSIHVSNVIAEVGSEFEGCADRLFPTRLGEEDDASAADTAVVRPPTARAERFASVPARNSGYVQAFDEGGLLAAATELDAVVHVERRPGDFAAEGQDLARVVWCGEPGDDDAVARFASKFVLGNRRTAIQDARFLLGQLVEIAIRALSPSVNDPRTAMDCVDWLVASLLRLAGRAMPAGCLRDDDGQARVVAEPVTFAQFVDVTFAQLRPYLAADANAAAHALAALGELAAGCPTEPRRAVVVDAARALLASAERSLGTAEDVERVRHAFPVGFAQG